MGTTEYAEHAEENGTGVDAAFAFGFRVFRVFRGLFLGSPLSFDYSATMWFRSTPMPSMAASIWSPGLR